MAFLRPAEGSRPPGRARALLLVLATVATALSGAGCAWLCGLAGYERRGEDRRAATPTAAPEVRRARSPAGHDVVVLAEPASPTVAVQLWSRRGPGDEPTDFAGLAALCGEAACTVRPAPPGVEVSGWTSLDSTVCEIVAPAGLEDVAIDHAAGLLAPDRSALEQRLVKVTPLVMARWRESRQDSHRVLLERLFSLTFGAGAYASPVLAHPPSLEGARLAEAAAHCASWLSAGEVSVVAVGDVSAAAVASRLRGGPWTRGREPLDERRHPDTTGPLVEVDLAPTAESMVAVGFRLPRSDVEETAALEVLAAALGGGPTSRVARTPLARSGLVVGTRAFVAPGRQGGVLVLTASLEGGEVSSAVEAMTALALAAGDEELTPAELEAARQALLGADAATAAGAEGAARRLGREAALGYEPDLGARWRAAVFAIDAATVAHHARERLRPSTLSVALLTGEHVRGEDEQGWPVVEGEAGELRRDVERLRNEIRTAVSRATDHASARPDPSPVTAGVRRVELAGGAVVLVSQEPAATEAAIVVALPGAAAWQADRRSGGAPLLATLLRREGTGPSPAPTPLRGALESTLDHDALSASGEFLPGELATALRSVLGALFVPRFSAEEVEQVRGELTAQAIAREDDPGEVALAEARAALHATRRYRLAPLGTVTGLDGQSRAQLMRLHRLVARPERLVVAVAGPVDAGRVARSVRDAIATLSVGAPPPAVPVEPVPAASGAAVELRVPIPSDRVHVVVAFGTEGIRSADTPARQVVASLLRFGENGLPARLETEGLALSTEVALFEGFDAGHLLIHVEAPPRSERAVLSSVRAALSRARQDGFSATAIEAARALAAALLSRSLADAAGRARSLARLELSGRRIVGGSAEVAAVLSVDAEAVATAARRLLDPSMEVVVVAGSIEDDVAETGEAPRVDEEAEAEEPRGDSAETDE